MPVAQTRMQRIRARDMARFQKPTGEFRKGDAHVAESHDPKSVRELQATLGLAKKLTL